MSSLAELRKRLDQKTEQIVSGLKDRSRFPLNPELYEPNMGLVKGNPRISALDLAIHTLESYHAIFGRFESPDQFPMSTGILPPSRLIKNIKPEREPQIAIDINPELKKFYIGLLKKYLEPGSNSDTYGETVTTDAGLLILIHERIHIGRDVAKVKLAADLALFDCRTDPGLLSARLRDIPREETLVEKTCEIARRYELSKQLTEDACRGIMAMTLALEVTYIQKLPHPPKYTPPLN